MSLNPRALKRVIRDYQEIQENPQPGIAIVQLDHTYQYFLVNIEILAGVSKGIKLQFELTLSSEFPQKAPKVKILPHQPYKYPFHHHIFGTRICLDILEDAWMDTKQLKTGWTSAYTFMTILIQIQSFLSDPDLPKNWRPKKSEYQELLQQQKKYSYTLEVDGQKIVHTWDKPYPAFPVFNMEKYELREQVKGYSKMDRIKERLTCFSLKENIVDFEAKTDVDQENLALGYPIDLKKDDFDRLHPIPITDILSFQGFKAELLANKVKVDKKTGLIAIQDEDYWYSVVRKLKFKSGMGSGYNQWMPIYINKEHFERNLERINHQLAMIKYGFNVPKGTFHPGVIFEVLPVILNKLVVYLLDGTVHQSLAAIEAYIHFAKLFREYLKKYSDICQQILMSKFKDFLKGDEYRCKRSLGDIGEFVQILMIAHENFHEDRSIMSALFREAMARQVMWIVKQRAELFKKYKEFTDYEKKYGETCAKQYALSNNLPQKIPENETQELYFSFRTQLISCRLFVFVIEVAKNFGTSKFLDGIESDYCIVQEKQLIQFIQNIKSRTKSIDSYQKWFGYLGFDDITTDAIYQRLVDSYQISNEQGYTFEVSIPDYEKQRKQKAIREKREKEKQIEMQKRANLREARKQEKREKQIQQDEKDVEEILQLSDQQKAIEKECQNLEKTHENIKKEIKKTLEQLKEELYEKYFDKNDPFSYYKNPEITKKYEKELKQLEQENLKKVVNVRAKVIDLEEKVENIYEEKWKEGESEIIARRKQRQEEEDKERMKWEAIQRERNEAWRKKQREIQEQKEQRKIQQNLARKEHRQKTNNGLGFDRIQEVKQKEFKQKKQQIQQQKKERVKNNLYCALESDDEEEEKQIKELEFKIFNQNQNQIPMVE